MTGFFHCTSGRSIRSDCFSAVSTISEENRSRRRARLIAGAGAVGKAAFMCPTPLGSQGETQCVGGVSRERRSAAEGYGPQVLGQRTERGDGQEEQGADDHDRPE